MADDLKYWVGFSRVPGIGPVRLRALLDHFGGDIRAAWQVSAATLRALGFDQRTDRDVSQAARPARPGRRVAARPPTWASRC